jgi:hypothetical protein
VAEGELTPEELVEALERLRVSDLLVSTCSTVAQLGYAKLDPARRDLEQARLAIDSLRALLPVLEGAVAAEALRDLRQVLTNLQLAYAGAAAEPSREEPPAEEPPAEEAPAEEPRIVESRAAEAPAEEPPGEETSAEEPPAEESPAGD